MKWSFKSFEKRIKPVPFFAQKITSLKGKTTSTIISKAVKSISKIGTCKKSAFQNIGISNINSYTSNSIYKEIGLLKYVTSRNSLKRSRQSSNILDNWM